jgi:O-antigen/teichoic acid export membrane protein
LSLSRSPIETIRRRWAKSPQVGRYLAAIVEQALWSLFNLGVNLMMARLVSPQNYGVFVFWSNCGFVLSSLQNALTVCHLQVLAPGAAMDPRRLETERLMHAVTANILVGVTAVTLGAGLLFGGASDLATPAAAIFLPAYLLQQYLRALTFSRGHAATAAIQTGLVLLLVAVFLGIAWALRPTLPVDLILLCMGAAYGLVGFGGMALACGRQLTVAMWGYLAPYGPFARQSGWVFLGVTTTELLVRFYAFIVAVWYGPAALAILSATQLFLRPVPLLASSWSMVARVDLARQRDAQDWKTFTRTIVLALAGGAPVALVWTLLIATNWRWISTHVFAGKYGEFGWMVALWGVSSALSFGQAVVASGLQVLKAFRVLALANAAASVVAASAIVLIMSRFGYGGAVAGTAIGQALEMTVMSILLISIIRRSGQMR